MLEERKNGSSPSSSFFSSKKEGVTSKNGDESRRVNDEFFLKIGGAMEVQFARSEACEKRCADLEARCRTLLHGLECERSANDALLRRIAVLERANEQVRRVVEEERERSLLKKGECERTVDEQQRANEGAMRSIRGDVEEAIKMAHAAKEMAKQTKRANDDSSVTQMQNELNVLKSEVARVEAEVREATRQASMAKKSANTAEKHVRAAEIETAKCENYAKTVGEFARTADRKMEAMKSGLHAANDAEVMLRNGVKSAKATAATLLKDIVLKAETSRKKVRDATEECEHIARRIAAVSDASIRETFETIETERERLKQTSDDANLQLQEQLETIMSKSKTLRENLIATGEETKESTQNACKELCEKLVREFVDERAKTLSNDVNGVVRVCAEEAANDARRCAEMCREVSELAVDKESAFQRKLDDALRLIDVAMAKAEAVSVDVISHKEDVTRCVDESLDALRRREITCSQRMQDESEENLRAFRRSVEEMKATASGGFDANDVIAIKKRCDTIEMRVSERERESLLHVGSIEHNQRELERMRVDFNDVRVEVAERAKRDDEVVRDVERVEQRLRDEIENAVDRANSFATMEIEPMKIESLEKIKSVCEVLFGFENAKLAVKDSCSIRAMAQTMLHDNENAMLSRVERVSALSLYAGENDVSEQTDTHLTTNWSSCDDASRVNDGLFAKLRHLQVISGLFEKKDEVKKLAYHIEQNNREQASVLKSLHEGVSTALRDRPTRDTVESLIKDISERVSDLETDTEVNKSRIRQVTENAKEIIDRRCEALETEHRKQLRKLAHVRLTLNDESATTSTTAKDRLENIMLEGYTKSTEMNAAIAGVENQIRRVEERCKMKLDLKADKSDVVVLGDRMINLD